MTSTKKISELQITNNLNEDDIHFLVIDKSKTTGEDASGSGKTSRVTLAQIRRAVESSGPKGQRGETGDKGAKGPEGPRGESGEPGRKGPQGYQGNDGDKGEQGETGEQGQQGIQGNPGVGIDGEKGQKGSQGERGERGETSSANSSLVLVTSDNIKLDPTHNKISKISGGGAWNANVISSIGFNTFNLSFGINQTNKNMAIGVGVASSSGLYDTDVNSIFLGFRFFTNGTYHVINGDSNISKSPVSYRTNSVFNLSFDKVKFTITQDGSTVGSFGFSGEVPNITYAFDSAFYDVGTNLTEFISFTPGANAIRGPKGDSGSKGQKGIPGSGSKGQKGEPATGKKGEKGPRGDFIKGQKGEPSTIKGPKGPQGNPSTIKGPKGPQGNASTIKGPKGNEGKKGPQGSAGISTWKTVPQNNKKISHCRSRGREWVLNVADYGIPATATSVILHIHSGEARLWRFDNAEWRLIHHGVNNGNANNYATVPLQKDYYGTQPRSQTQIQMLIDYAPGDDRDCCVDIFAKEYFGP